MSRKTTFKTVTLRRHLCLKQRIKLEPTSASLTAKIQQQASSKILQKHVFPPMSCFSLKQPYVMIREVILHHPSHRDIPTNKQLWGEWFILGFTSVYFMTG
jgi:hypothetical protein